jgi:uncharacterized protein
VTTLAFTIIIFLGAMAGGFVGSLAGIGGGIIVTPLLTVFLGVDIHYAIGASLIAVIATSSGAAATYVKEGYTNIRIGMFLEVATVFGALLGAFLATVLHASTIAVIFGIMLLFSASQSGMAREDDAQDKRPVDPLTARLAMDSSYPARDGMKKYRVHSAPLGFCVMFIAGVFSGLLGIGAGVLKVLAMDRAMKIPFKVSTTTSNFMMGVTAAASAGIYLNRGYIEPVIVMPVVLGVLIGATFGTRKLFAARTKSLRLLFFLLVVFMAIQMIYKGLSGKI